MSTQTNTGIEVHRVIAKAVKDHDIDTMFGLLGDANLFMADNFVRRCGGNFVAATHESNAVLMALGHALVSGKVGVATVTHGPALSNCVTALIEGVKGSLPMVLLCGDTSVMDPENQQNIPQRELVIATGAGFEQLRAPQTAALDVATAFRRAEIERRPVVLNMPSDFMWQMTEAETEILPACKARTGATLGPDLDDAVGIIAAARRPIILAGRGACSARDTLAQLAQRIGAPLATTLKAKGLFGDTPFNMGVFGTLSTPAAVEAIMASDCILSFGASLNRFTTAKGAYLDDKRVVQIDTERGAIGKFHPITAGLVGDPGPVAEILIHWLDQAEIPASGFTDTLDATALAEPMPVAPDTSCDGTVDLTTALIRLNTALPSDRIAAFDGGRFMGEAWIRFDVPDPSRFVYTVNSGSIGLGMGHAIGAAHGMPDTPVVLVTGDGGFMQGGLNEFATAVAAGIDLIVIICNDQAYGAEYVQFTDRQMDPSLSQFDWPSFAKVACALGGIGVTVGSVGDLDKAISAVKRRDKPVIINLMLDPKAVPRLQL